MICGIDLGTTNSLIAVWQDAKPRIIPNKLGSNLTPSVVSLNDDGSILVGQAAKERLSTHPHVTVANFKSFMGTNREVRLGPRAFRAEELSSFVLRSLVKDAESELGQKITEAIVTVPAYFNDSQRKATRVAGELAGLKVERLLNEPTAAAIAYGLHTKVEESQYLVFDLGGGTFDVSILEMFDGVMEVHASAGDNHLGGNDFTKAIANYFIKQTDIGAWGVDRELLPDAFVQSLLVQCEKAKRDIGAKGEGEIALNWQDKVQRLKVNENEMEEIVAPLLDRITLPIKAALHDAKVRVADLDEIVLVGGATRMPAIKKLVTRLFQRFPAAGIHPDEVVVHGAAIQAGLKSRDSALNDVVLTDVCPYTLGIEVSRGHQNTHGHFAPIIERNNYIPVSRVERFYTMRDAQTLVEVKVYQGENPMVSDNIFIGKLNVPVPAGPAGKEGIDVRFTYDINGILEVIVKIVNSQKSYTLVIEENPGVLSADEIRKRFAELEVLKIHPRELQENTSVLNRAARLYREFLGRERELVGDYLAQFESVLNDQNPKEIEVARKKFIEILNQLEGDTGF